MVAQAETPCTASLGNRWPSALDQYEGERGVTWLSVASGQGRENQELTVAWGAETKGSNAAFSPVSRGETPVQVRGCNREVETSCLPWGSPWYQGTPPPVPRVSLASGETWSPPPPPVG